MLSKLIGILLGLGFVCLVFSSCVESSDAKKPMDLDIQVYLSTADGEAKFEAQDDMISQRLGESTFQININKNRTYQTMDGFGYTLTGGSAQLLNQMSASARANLLQELFGTEGDGIGISYLRISIGASDLDAEVFSYNDLADGETDPNLDRFSIEPDRKHLIPILKEILAISSDLKIMASPWSPPVWMKTNRLSKGGNLKTEYYDAYAQYFVKYIQAMTKEGIVIDAITIQNEPLHPGNNPSMKMTAFEQGAFIKQSLGPFFAQNDIATKIVLYDHNADRTDYPLQILDDPEANQYVDGSAFHLYGGRINDLSQVHDAHPDKHLYFTEQWIGAPGNFDTDVQWHINELIIGATRNWCKVILEWNLAADPDLKPHTDGGCTQCLGALTIYGDQVVRNPAYYIIAHASKYVRPGAQSIESNTDEELPNVAFRTSDATVIIVLNNSNELKQFNIQLDGQTISSQLASGSVATYVWKDLNN